MWFACLVFMTACGNENKSGTTEATEENAEQKEETTPIAVSVTFDDFSAQLKDICGVAPIVNDKMTKILVRKDSENEYFMSSPVVADIDGEAVQREYFNSFAKVADGNKIYGFNMNGSRGNDSFNDYDEYVKFIKANGCYAKTNYSYDYNGKQVNVYCSVSFGDFGLNVTILNMAKLYGNPPLTNKKQTSGSELTPE